MYNNMERINSSKEPLKCLIIGDNSVGKTSVIARMELDDCLLEERIDDYAINRSSENIISKIINYSCCRSLEFTFTVSEVRDISSIEEITADVIVLCFSLVHPISFSKIEKEFHPTIQQKRPHIPIILMGTKLDLRNDNEIFITKKQGIEMSKNIKAASYVECSVKNPESVDVLLKKLKNVQSEEPDSNYPRPICTFL